MKKLIIMLITLFVGVLQVSAQTYCYKYLYSVDENGRKYVDGPRDYSFVTFKDSKRCCYMSNIDGSHVYGDDISEYKGSSNGILTYECTLKFKWFDFHGNPTEQELGEEHFYFSSDYSRMNYTRRVQTMKYNLAVYEKVEMPEGRQEGKKLY